MFFLKESFRKYSDRNTFFKYICSDPGIFDFLEKALNSLKDVKDFAKDGPLKENDFLELDRALSVFSKTDIYFKYQSPPAIKGYSRSLVSFFNFSATTDLLKSNTQFEKLFLESKMQTRRFRRYLVEMFKSPHLIGPIRRGLSDICDEIKSSNCIEVVLKNLYENLNKHREEKLGIKIARSVLSSRFED